MFKHIRTVRHISSNPTQTHVSAQFSHLPLSSHTPSYALASHLANELASPSPLSRARPVTDLCLPLFTVELASVVTAIDSEIRSPPVHIGRVLPRK